MPYPEKVAVQSKLSEQTIKQYSGSRDFNRVALFNIAMSAVVAALLLFYVIDTNEITANNYKIKLLNDKLLVLNETTTKLTINKNYFDNSARVLEFAQGQNMIEARNISYLFENGAVAIQR